MRKRPPTRQYTIRAMPDMQERALRQKARSEGKSLNQAAIDALLSGLGLTEESAIHSDLDNYIGTWVEDPDFDAIIASHDVVDPEKWR